MTLPQWTVVSPPGWWCMATDPCTAPTPTGTTARSSRREPGLACLSPNGGVWSLYWLSMEWIWQCGLMNTAMRGCYQHITGRLCLVLTQELHTTSPGLQSTSLQVMSYRNCNSIGFFISLYSGSAGCREKHDDFNKTHPDWSAFRSTDYGYSRFYFANSTHMRVQQVSAEKNGTVIDEVWIVQNSHEPFHSIL